MVLQLTLGDLYGELHEDPDLRRLGEYKVVAGERQSIFAIDFDSEGRGIHFGEGDFTDCFVALCETKAPSIDFGASKFTDLYLDYLKTDVALFSKAQASRLYYDDAEVKISRFGDFVAPEIYFDTAFLDGVEGENLRAGIIYYEDVPRQQFDRENVNSRAHRISLHGDRSARPETEGVNREVRELRPEEFLVCLERGALSELGPYCVVPPEGDYILEINADLKGRTINLGEGDFTAMQVSLGSTRADILDFGKSKFGDVDFREAEIGSCFFSDFHGNEVRFANAEIRDVFGEQGAAKRFHLEGLRSEQFNVNNMVAEEFRLGEAKIGEIYLSRGEGIHAMFGERAEVGLLNLHEGRLKELDFGHAHIESALLNKSRIEMVRAEGLRADRLYIGDAHGNEIGRLEIGLGLGIGELYQKGGAEVKANAEGQVGAGPEGEGRVVVGEFSKINR